MTQHVRQPPSPVCVLAVAGRARIGRTAHQHNSFISTLFSPPLCTVQCGMYTVGCTVYSVHCTVSTVQSRDPAAIFPSPGLLIVAFTLHRLALSNPLSLNSIISEVKYYYTIARTHYYYTEYQVKFNIITLSLR